jgi:anti-sigma regulatory factor (Ser/Thr protein kinase)
LPRRRTARGNRPPDDGGPVTRARADARRGPAEDGFHAAGLVDSDDQLFAEAARYVRAGIAQDDLVVIGGTPVFQQAMAEEFGDSDGVEFDDGVRLNGRRAPDAIGHSVRLSERAAGRGSGRLRILAQVDYSADSRATREFACFEAAANLASTAVPVSALCLYDSRRLPADVLAVAPRTHPFLVEAGDLRPSEAYADPRDFVRGLPLPREPLQDGDPLLAIDGAPVLAGLRHALGDVLTRVVHDREQREDLHLGLSEMAANAFRHGAPPVSARIWASADRVVCSISDHGRGVDPLAGYWPAHGEDLGRGGMGLWLARKLFDHVDLSRDGGTTVVRLATALR